MVAARARRSSLGRGVYRVHGLLGEGVSLGVANISRNRPVSLKLEESKADEYGQAIHEECYVSTLVRKKPVSVSLRSDAHTGRATLVPPTL